MAQDEGLVGIDVSKGWLDAHGLPGGQERRFSNDVEGIRSLVAWVKGLGVGRAAFEATGGYEQAAAKALRRSKLKVRIVDPKRVRHYAKAYGQLAKTDRIDARMIAKFAVAVFDTPMTAVPEGPAYEALGALVGARQDLVDHRTGLANQAGATPAGQARHVLEAAAALIAREIVRLDRLIAKAIAAEAPFAVLSKRLGTVPGLGPVTVAALIAWLPELGQLGRRKIAGLVGVAPYPEDSGDHSSPRHIAGGRTKLRNILYMATLGAATRHNPVLKKCYDRLVGGGKLAKVALVACMRKLLHIVNTMVARGEDWNPPRAAAAVT